MRGRTLFCGMRALLVDCSDLSPPADTLVAIVECGGGLVVSRSPPNILCHVDVEGESYFREILGVDCNIDTVICPSSVKEQVKVLVEQALLLAADDDHDATRGDDGIMPRSIPKLLSSTELVDRVTNEYG